MSRASASRSCTPVAEAWDWPAILAVTSILTVGLASTAASSRSVNSFGSKGLPVLVEVELDGLVEELLVELDRVGSSEPLLLVERGELVLDPPGVLPLLPPGVGVEELETESSPDPDVGPGPPSPPHADRARAVVAVRAIAAVRIRPRAAGRSPRRRRSPGDRDRRSCCSGG